MLRHKKACDVAYFGFSKALDSVSQRELLQKIFKLGEHPTGCKWLQEFLNDGTFQVKAGRALPHLKQVKNSVFQGGYFRLCYSFTSLRFQDYILIDDGVVEK